MSTAPTTETAASDQAVGEPAAHAIIGWYPYGTASPWQGRYLHDAPSITQVATKLCQIVAQRHSNHEHGAISELIKQHPAGWRSLGTTTAKDPERKIRRRPAPPGVCLCHFPDGTPTPAMISSGLQALTMIDHEAPVRLPGYADGEDPTAIGHWTIYSTSATPPGTGTLFLFGHNKLTVGVRTAARQTFLYAGTLSLHRPDLDRLPEIVANAEWILRRTPEAIKDVHAAAADRLHPDRHTHAIPDHL